MQEAIRLSCSHRPHPNPRVGAIVLDRRGVVVGTGAHEKPGTAHAEVHAILAAGDAAAGGELVVTLEPCSHHGRTPPCVDAIIRAGITRVWVGAIDPDGRVSGQGIERLRAAGVEVETGVAAAAVEAADPGYFHHRRTGRSRVIHKAALTLDGQTAAADGTSRWITGSEARRDAHALRASVDAVMVGAGTLLADDPLLDVRLSDYTGTQPRPVIVAGTRPLPPNARLWGRDPLVVAPAPIPVPGELVVVPAKAGQVDLEAALTATGEAGLLDVMVEGGAGLSASLWEEGLIDYGVWYVASKVAGGVGSGLFDRAFATLVDARVIDFVDVRRVGEDLRVEWRAGSGGDASEPGN